jgi:ABC-type phosphate transport system permease subunit
MRYPFWQELGRHRFVPNAAATSADFATLSPPLRDGLSIGFRALGGVMIKLIIDVVLFSSMFTLVTGIVLAAARVLG